MARILLGVSGGIAAYKALELARLATKEGHAVRVLMTPAAEAVRRRRLLRGHRRRPGPHATSSSATRRAAPFPATRLPSTTRSATSRSSPTRTPTWSRRPRPTPSRSSRPGSPTRWSPPPSWPATAPRLVAPAMNDRMYRDAATQANLATLRERGHHRDRSRRGRARLARRARRWAGCPSRGPAAGCGRGSRLPGRAAPGTACASWSRPGAPASRSIPSASSATAPAGGWASPSPSAPPAAAPRSPWWPPTSRCRHRPASRRVDVETAAELEQRSGRRVRLG